MCPCTYEQLNFPKSLTKNIQFQTDLKTSQIFTLEPTVGRQLRIHAKTTPRLLHCSTIVGTWNWRHAAHGRWKSLTYIGAFASQQIGRLMISERKIARHWIHTLQTKPGQLSFEIICVMLKKLIFHVEKQIDYMSLWKDPAVCMRLLINIGGLLSWESNWRMQSPCVVQFERSLLIDSFGVVTSTNSWILFLGENFLRRKMCDVWLQLHKS